MPAPEAHLAEGGGHTGPARSDPVTLGGHCQGSTSSKTALGEGDNRTLGGGGVSARGAPRQLQEEEGRRRAWVGDVEEDLRARLGALQRCEAGEAAGRSELAVAEGQARTQLEVGRGDRWVVFWRRRQLELEELEHRQPVLQGESYARLHLLQVMDCQHRWVYPPYYLGYYP